MAEIQNVSLKVLSQTKILNWNSFVEYKWFHHMSCLKYNIYHYKSWYLSPQVKYKMFHQKTCLKCKRFAKVLFQIQNLVLSTKCYTTVISWSQISHHKSCLDKMLCYKICLEYEISTKVLCQMQNVDSKAFLQCKIIC